MISELSSTLVLLSALCATVASLAALRPRGALARLHYVNLIGLISGPLLVPAVLIGYGPGAVSASVGLIVLVLALTNPVLGAAIGKANAENANPRQRGGR